MLEGGCTCSAVRFQLAEEPYDTGWCHCRVCQHVSGAGGMLFTTAKLKNFTIVKGAAQMGKFASTPFGERGFCTACGAPLTIHVRYQAEEIGIAAGALDDPGAVRPAFHLYASWAPPWIALDDGPPIHAELRPTTRGLAPGQTAV